MGWALCTWFPAMRHVSRKFDHTTMVVPTGWDCLVSDFADEIINHDPKGKGDRWLIGGKKPTLPFKPKGCWYQPSKEKCTKWKREYFKYGERLFDQFSYDILIHARAKRTGDWIDKAGRKNWTVRHYEKMLEMLPVQNVACIGSKDASYIIPGTEDLRGIPMKELCDEMASCKVVVGSSSGPMHLAHLCGAPIVVWTDDTYQKAISGTNRDRYKKIWRAFNSPVKVLDKWGWMPDPKIVGEHVNRFLRQPS